MQTLDISAVQQSEARIASVAVVLITLNEAHNMEALFQNLAGFAKEIFVLDSYSSDDTVDIALSRGAYVAQRRFSGFGDQWNFALSMLPISAEWTMKMDPDERLSDELKASILQSISEDSFNGFYVRRRLWFMGRAMPVRQEVLRIWRTGFCRFGDVLVNEHPVVKGKTRTLSGDLEHHDSPNLHHWFSKQNYHGTLEALAWWRGDDLSVSPSLFASSLQRRMWLKQKFNLLPFRYLLMQLYCLLVMGAWRAGVVGYVWSRLRADVYRYIGYKRLEMKLLGHSYTVERYPRGAPHPAAKHFD